MFASNQTMEVSGNLWGNEQLKLALEFALTMEGDIERFKRKDRTVCVFQKADYGGFCIGWNLIDSPEKGWEKFQFDFDTDIIASIIALHIKNVEFQLDRYGDGSHDRGFLMKVIDCDTPGVKEPFYGIVAFYPYDCYYAK